MVGKYAQVISSTQVAVALLTTVLLCLGQGRTQAQTPGSGATQFPATTLSRRPTAAYTVLYVDPLRGDDVRGTGDQQQPFRTITQALAVAQPSTVIALAPGRYSVENGESFPLRLRPGITIQGRPGVGAQAMIIGGGAFRSDTLSQQNAAILTADRSGLAQVIVSNPNPQGHGVWVESGNPVIREISLVSNRHTGIYVAGGAPIIEGNNFFQNQIAGLVLYGNSRAVVRGNQFESTGTAIAVADTATPEIVNNRIVGNDEGIVLLGNARPQVADNSMVQNRRNGVVEVATRSPVAVPSNNAPIASRQALQSDLAPRQTAPTTSPLIAPEPAPQAAEIPPPKPPALPPLPARTASLPAPTVSSPPPPVSEQPVSLPADSATPFPAATTSAPSLAALRRGLTSPATADPVSRTEATEPVAAPDPVATATPISIASLRNRRAVARSGESSPTPVSATTASLPRQTGAVEIPVIPAPAVPPVNQSARLPDLPTLTANTNRLQVPNSTIPLGSGSGANLNLAALALPDGSSPPPPPSRAAVLGLHYRVFVEGSDESTQAKLRTLVPDAFRTRYEGRMVMQAGAFPDQATAEERVQLLLDNGLEARLEYTP